MMTKIDDRTIKKLANFSFHGVFQGARFDGKYAGRCGEIVVQVEGHQLEVYWELGVSGAIVEAIPCRWKVPDGQVLTEQQQLEILDALQCWLRSNNVPNDLVDEPWMSAPDDKDFKCAWGRCENLRITGYAICRDHMRRGYLDARLDRAY